jgi:hypothetical protein
VVGRVDVEHKTECRGWRREDRGKVPTQDSWVPAHAANGAS